MPPKRKQPDATEKENADVPVKSKEHMSMVQLCCVPRRVIWVNDYLKKDPRDPRFAFIKRTCFKGLLMLRTKVLKVKPMLSLMSNWDPENECFQFPDCSEINLKDEDVARVYGLPRGFGKVPIDINKSNVDIEFVRAFIDRNHLPVKASFNIKDDDMHLILTKGDHEIAQNPEDYWRLYVVNALYALFAPTSDRFISLRFVQYLRDPVDAAEINWASFVRDRLVTGLNKWVEKIRNGKTKSGRPNGDLHCLMV